MFFLLHCRQILYHLSHQGSPIFLQWNTTQPYKEWNNATCNDMHGPRDYRGAPQVVLVVKNPLANARDVRDVCLTPGLERPPGGGQGNPLQHSCMENPMDKGAYSPYRVTKSLTQLKRFSTFTCKGYHSKWSKPDRERQISYDIIFMWNLK